MTETADNSKVNRGENLPSSIFIGLVASLSPSGPLVNDISFLLLKLLLGATWQLISLRVSECERVHKRETSVYL